MKAKRTVGRSMLLDPEVCFLCAVIVEDVSCFPPWPDCCYCVVQVLVNMKGGREELCGQVVNFSLWVTMRSLFSGTGQRRMVAFSFWVHHSCSPACLYQMVRANSLEKVCIKMENRKTPNPKSQLCLVGRKHLANNTMCLLFCPPMLRRSSFSSASNGFHLWGSGGWLTLPTVHSQFTPFHFECFTTSLCGFALPAKQEDRESLLEEASWNCPVCMKGSTGDESIVKSMCPDGMHPHEVRELAELTAKQHLVIFERCPGAGSILVPHLFC